MPVMRAWRYCALSILLLFAFLSWDPPALSADLQPTPDTAEYTLGALTWLRTGRYGIILNDKWFPSRYPPGYAALLVPFFAVVGPQPALAATLNWVVALGMLMLFLLTARRLVGSVGALVAGGLLAFSPTVEWLATRIGTEMPSLLVMWAAAALLTLPTAAVSFWAAIAAGLLVGLSSLLRLPNLLWAAPLLPLLKLPATASTAARSQTATHMMLFALGVSVGLLPLLAYQTLFFGSPLMTGYRYWDLESYGTLAATFNPAYLMAGAFGPGAAGNLSYYSRVLLGLAPGVDRLYVPTVPVLALAGLSMLARRSPMGNRRVAAMALLGFLTFLGFFGLYYWQETRLMAPLVPLVVLAAGAAVGRAWSQRQRSWVARLLLVIVVLSLVGQSVLAVRNAYLLGGRERVSLPWRVATLQWLDRHTPRTATLVTDLDLALVEEYWRRNTGRQIVPLVHEMEWVRRAPLRRVPVGLASVPRDTRTIFLLSAREVSPASVGMAEVGFSIQRVYTATFGGRLVTAYELMRQVP